MDKDGCTFLYPIHAEAKRIESINFICIQQKIVKQSRAKNKPENTFSIVYAKTYKKRNLYL